MPMSNFYSSINLVYIVVTLCVVVGGIFAFRHGFTRTANEVQERVINALSAELTALSTQIEMLTKRLNELEQENIRLTSRQNELDHENIRLRMIITAICNAMKRRRINIDIEQDFIQIKDESGGIETQRIFEHPAPAQQQQEARGLGLFGWTAR